MKICSKYYSLSVEWESNTSTLSRSS